MKGDGPQRTCLAAAVPISVPEVVGTRCGEGGDYKLRRTGHPVAVV